MYVSKHETAVSNYEMYVSKHETEILARYNGNFSRLRTALQPAVRSILCGKENVATQRTKATNVRTGSKAEL